MIWHWLRQSATLAVPFLVALSAASPLAVAQTAPEVWFMPAGASPDIDDLFTHPDEWPRARSRINVFAFSPGQLTIPKDGRPTLLSGLVAVNAFRTLGAWGIGTALEVPAIKEFDCTGNWNARVTASLIEIVYVSGGAVQFLDMDEPLISGLGLNVPKCHLDIDQTAAATAEYATAVTTNPKITAHGPPPRIVDIEAYPSLSVQQIEQWISALERDGLKLAGFDIDVDVHYINIHTDIKSRLDSDLQALKNFMSVKKMPFGIIIWSGYDPVPSDQEYYNDAMDWVRTVHRAIGSPDRLVFESWVTRCSQSGPCTGPHFGCSTSDPGDCGSVSVPLNLPENDRAKYRHARLINDALAIFGQP